VEPQRISNLEEYEQQIGHLEKKARARMIEGACGMHSAGGKIARCRPRRQARPRPRRPARIQANQELTTDYQSAVLPR
jgi:hypothetical protein